MQKTRYEINVETNLCHYGRSIQVSVVILENNFVQLSLQSLSSGVLVLTLQVGTNVGLLELFEPPDVLVVAGAALDHLQPRHDVLHQAGLHLAHQLSSLPRLLLPQPNVHQLDEELDGAALDEAGEEDHGYKVK